MKILIAVDGSSFTKRMLAYLAAHDEWLGSQHLYTVVHVAHALPGRATAVVDKSTLQAFYAEESEKVLKPIRTFFSRQKIAADFVAKVGPVAETIASMSTKGQYDMLMMGSHGHTLLGSMLLGSVSSKVMASCETPVLIVR